MGGGWTRPFVAELVGTFFLVFAGAGSIIIDRFTGGSLGLLGIALAHGLALSVAVSATAAASGGHINPAVSLAMWATGRLRAALLPVYVLGQLLGGVVAGVLLQISFPAEPSAATHLGTPVLAEGVGAGQGVLIEAILTFMLLFAIFGTAVDRRAPQLGGFGIGLTVAFDILAGGPLTGAAMNPARAFGTAVPAGFWAGHLVYWIGPVIGALIGAFVYQTWVLGRDDEAVD